MIFPYDSLLRKATVCSMIVILFLSLVEGFSPKTKLRSSQQKTTRSSNTHISLLLHHKHKKCSRPFSGTHLLEQPKHSQLIEGNGGEYWGKSEKYASSRRRFFDQLTMSACSTASLVWMMIPASSASAVSSMESSMQQTPPDHSALPTTPTNPTVTSTKPFAPLEALLPAARVKVTIDQSVQLAQAIQAHPDDISGNLRRQTQLGALLMTPGRYMKHTVTTTDNTLLADEKTNTISLLSSSDRPPKQKYTPAKAYLDTYDRNRQQLPLAFQPGALLVQNGEINAWRRLKRQEAVQESQDEIRAALNTYTQALTFRADAYLLTVSPQERSQMVRQDRLPDIKQVIASDMGMRYLYRNQLLTSMAEVKAELEYQLAQQQQQQQNQSDQTPSPTVMDVLEVLPLLLEAQSACDTWFGFIEPEQIQAALQMVEQEEANPR